MKKKNTYKQGVVYAVSALFVVFFIFIAAVFFDSSELDHVTVDINEGVGVFGIANALENSGVISSRIPFLIYVILAGKTDNLQAGEYLFTGDYTMHQIARFVSLGTSLASERVVTIPEGFRFSGVGARLAVEGIGDGVLTGASPALWEDEFSFLTNIGQTTLEGFLFPDTYRFDKDATDEEVIRTMLTNFAERTEDIRSDAAQKNQNFYSIVIFASILEREVPLEDMRRAAGVIAKRLEVGMALQVDATLAYALDRPIVRSDVDTFTSPYNTYQVVGLPPTPISNPGTRALIAASDPEKNDFWFYLSRPDTGETVFSRTFQEHDSARAQYLR